METFFLTQSTQQYTAKVIVTSQTRQPQPNGAGKGGRQQPTWIALLMGGIRGAF